MSSLLEIRDLKVNYGGIEALKGVSFDVKEGEIVTLIGANGAGKSTTLRAIMSVVNPASGTISYEGKDITHAATHDIVQRGIVLVPEGRRVFPNLTVLENLRIGAYLREDKDAIEHDIEHVYSLFPRLNERHWQQAGTLSGGAADAGRWPGAHGKAKGYDDGRTQPRPGAPGGKGYILHNPPHK